MFFFFFYCGLLYVHVIVKFNFIYQQCKETRHIEEETVTDGLVSIAVPLLVGDNEIVENAVYAGRYIDWWI